MTITLPSEWTKKLHLKAGDEVEIIERENTLVINGHDRWDKKAYEVDISDFTVPLIWRYMQSMYRSGCDEMTIYFDADKKGHEDAYHYYTTQFDYSKLGEKVPLKPAIAMIQEVVNRFIGIDIIETGKQHVRIKEMAELHPTEFDNSFRRIFITIMHLFERMIEAIETDEIGDPALCKELHTLDLGVDKFVDYCARILTKVSIAFPETKKQLLFSSLFILELIGDEFKYIGKHLALTNESVKEVAVYAKMVKDHFEKYYKLYYSFSRDLAVEFGKCDTILYRAHFDSKDKLSGENRSIMKHLMLISKFTLALVELRIQMEY